jgi:hypothetical protein
MKRCANMACVAGAAEGQTYRFRTPFLWFVSFGGAKEMNIHIKKKGCSLYDTLKPGALHRAGGFK